MELKIDVDEFVHWNRERETYIKWLETQLEILNEVIEDESEAMLSETDIEIQDYTPDMIPDIFKEDKHV